MPTTELATQDDGQDKIVFFQDGFNQNDIDIASYLFEMANAPLVGYRVEDCANELSSSSRISIVVEQDKKACGNHTGGIVWETAYLLADYLVRSNMDLGNILEVGAGCGLLGLVLAARTRRIAATSNSNHSEPTRNERGRRNKKKTVILTETADVMHNLESNLQRNLPALEKFGSSHQVSACRLDWENCERDAACSNLITPHSFDTIVGTDVVFTTKLVEPLLHTLEFLSHSKTIVYLCLQERCLDSYHLLFKKASKFGFEVDDITDEVISLPHCAWGAEMDCKVLRAKRQKKKKRKR